jgi:hypothetical protein
MATTNGQIELVYVVVVRPTARGNAVRFTSGDLPGSDSPCINPVDILALVYGLVSAWLSASPALSQLSKKDAFSPKIPARQEPLCSFEILCCSLAVLHIGNPFQEWPSMIGNVCLCPQIS